MKGWREQDEVKPRRVMVDGMLVEDASVRVEGETLVIRLGKRVVRVVLDLPGIARLVKLLTRR